MAKDKVTTSIARGGKPGRPGPAAAPTAEPAAPKKRTPLPQFFKEVRAEARKITWTSWKETWINSVLVFILVTLTAIFFLLVDGTLSFLIQQLLRLASS
jgi:preprotein translocase subunit SecE